MYKSYREAAPVSFEWEEYVIFPVLPLLAIAVLSYVSLYFLGLYPSLVLGLLLSFVINFLYLGLKNMGGDASRSIFSESSLPSYLFIVVVITIVDLGVYLLVLYQKTHVFYTYLFSGWVFVVFGLPLLYFSFLYARYYYFLYAQALYFTKIMVEVYYDHEFLIKVDELSFNNSQKRRTARFLFSRPRAYHTTKQGRDWSIETRNDFLYGPTYKEQLQVPKHSDQVKIAWYAIGEDAYYEQVINFPYEQLQFEPNEYPEDEPKILRGQKTDRLRIVIHPKGGIDLFAGSKLLLQQQCLKVPLRAEEKLSKVVTLKSTNDSELPVDYFEALLADHQVTDRIASRAQLREALFFCSLNLEGAKHQLLEVKDIKNKGFDIKVEGGDMLVPPVQQALPRSITMSGAGTDWSRWLIIHLDTEKLYELLQDHKTDTFEICLTVDIHKGAVFLDIKIKGVFCKWTHWEKTIDRENLKLALGKLKERNEREVKNAVWNEIYTLMAAKQYMAAQERCRRAFKEDPEDMMLYFYEARLLYYTKGREACYKKEAYFLDKTVHDKHAWARAINSFGCMLEEDSKYEAALGYFQKSSAAMPEVADYIANQAEIYYKMGKAKQAVDCALQSQQKGGDFKILNEILQNKGKKKA
jgi:hypothetical protein